MPPKKGWRRGLSRGDLHDLYCNVMYEVQDACRDHRMPFQIEIGSLCVLWLHHRARAFGMDPQLPLDQFHLFCIDDLEIPTVSDLIWRIYRQEPQPAQSPAPLPSVLISDAIVLESTETYQVVEGDPHAQRTSTEYVGPTPQQLALLRPGQFIRIMPDPDLSLSTMQLRVRDAKKIEGCSETLHCWRRGNGLILVEP